MTSEPPDRDQKSARNRAHLRIPLRALQIRGESKKLFFFGYARNLSVGGLFIQTTNPKPPGTKVRLQFSPQRGLPAIECSAEVIWTRPFDVRSQDLPGMGLRFTLYRFSPDRRICSPLRITSLRRMQ